MKRFTSILAMLVLVLVVALSSSPVFAKDNWISVRSKNFLLIGNANEKQIRQVAVRLEQFREVFAQLFPKAVHTTPVPTTVVVFKSDDSYRPFKPNPNVAGYFQSGEDVNYITLTIELRGEQDPFDVIFHEYTHLLVNNTTPNVPLWFNEGLAEYYSTFSITDDTKIMLGTPISSHVFLLRENKMLPLRTLFQVDEKSPYYNERDKQSIFYAESWALMHYWILGKEGRVMQMANFLKFLSANTPLEEAFQQAFGTSFESMEKELREYIKRDRYPVMTGHFESKIAVETAMQAAPISDAEAQAYLGDLLLHSHRADGETYLKKALALDPNLPMANASMAMFLLRQGQIVESRKLLERAAANSQNYLIHYYYAYALSRQSNGNDDEIVSSFAADTASVMRAELKKAIELRPDFAESYNLLAFVNLVTGTNIDESIALLEKVLASAPGKNDSRFMLAQLYLQKEDYKTARPLLEQLSGIYNDGVTRQRAQFMLDQLKARQEALARFKASSANRTPLIVEQTDVEQPVNNDPSSYLREALRKPETGESQVQGVLERIDCDAKGVIFNVRIDGRVLRLRAANFESVDMTSFTPDSGNAISCGPRKTESVVVVCYVANSDARAKVDGTLSSLEFVPKDFRLKAGGTTN